jgi:hypothetical protein
MMAYLVFVHGVATRDSAEYQAAVKNRTALIEKVLFDGRTVTVSSPLWGDLVPVINEDVYKTNAGGVGVYRIGKEMLDDQIDNSGSEVSASAAGKTAPVATLDAIFAELVEGASSKGEKLKPEEIEAFAKAVNQIAAKNPGAAFKDSIDDAALARQLAATGAAYGVASSIRNAIGAVTDRIKHSVSTIGFEAVRGRLTPTVGIFLGDVFAYLNDSDTREKICSAVRKELTAAHSAAKKNKRPLLLMGHSLGGVILTDMLLNLADAGLPEDIEVPSLITIGSQPGFFATLNLLARHMPRSGRIPRPACVRDWTNVFDPIDPFAFRADMIFESVTDLKFDTVAGLFDTHSAYFSRPQFYARTRSRLKELGII